MQELSSEFEDLFDPYLPIASKLKIKTCPALGVSVINANQNAVKVIYSRSRPLSSVNQIRISMWRSPHPITANGR